MTLRDLQDQAKLWIEHNFSSQSTYQPLLGVVEEVGELAHAHLKREQNIRINEDHEAKAKDAIGDVIIYLTNYCTLQGWDIEKIVEDVWAEVSKRDWVANPEEGVSIEPQFWVGTKISQECSTCGRPVLPRKQTGLVGDTPIASKYTEHFWCSVCKREWEYKPYVEGFKL